MKGMRPSRFSPSADDSTITGLGGIQELSAGAAFENNGGAPHQITGRVAVGTVGRFNSAMWRQVN